nr:hypothetical protein [Tanacetum cinerariifolium]
MNVGSVNIPYLLAWYLRIFASRRKQEIYEELDDTWAWVAPRQERQPNAAAGALKVAEGTPDIDKGAQAVPAPCEVMDAMTRDFYRFTVWAASGISQLLDVSRDTYTRSKNKLVHLEEPLIPIPLLAASQAARHAYEALFDAQNEVSESS